MVCETEPHVRLCADSLEPAWDSLSPSLFALPLLLGILSPSLSLSLSLSLPLPCLCVHSLSLKINKLKKKKTECKLKAKHEQQVYKMCFL